MKFCGEGKITFEVPPSQMETAIKQTVDDIVEITKNRIWAVETTIEKDSILIKWSGEKKFEPFVLEKRLLKKNIPATIEMNILKKHYDNERRHYKYVCHIDPSKNKVVCEEITTHCKVMTSEESVYGVGELHIFTAKKVHDNPEIAIRMIEIKLIEEGAYSLKREDHPQCTMLKFSLKAPYENTIEKVEDWMLEKEIDGYMCISKLKSVVYDPHESYQSHIHPKVKGIDAKEIDRNIIHSSEK
ncbi:MAG: hypothetical protein ACXQTP_00155 [Candidatus Methanofastidiosia archaeon]